MFERVLVEQDYYDGPKSGVAFFSGVPHRFSASFDEARDEFSETFQLWPINNKDLDLELEQWSIFVAWNRLYEAGTATTDSHPGVGGVDSRWDEIETELNQSRSPPSHGAVLARASFKRLDRAERYDISGPDYSVEWSNAAAV